MKFLAIFLLVAVAVALPPPELSDDEEWELFKVTIYSLKTIEFKRHLCTFSFKGKHAKKGFKSAEEHDFRKALFKEAHAVIKAHNNENHTFKLAHNKHSMLVSLSPEYV